MYKRADFIYFDPPSEPGFAGSIRFAVSEYGSGNGKNMPSVTAMCMIVLQSNISSRKNPTGKLGGGGLFLHHFFNLPLVVTELVL